LEGTKNSYKESIVSCAVGQQLIYSIGRVNQRQLQKKERGKGGSKGRRGKKQGIRIKRKDRRGLGKKG
jgi:hypothetical protein